MSQQHEPPEEDSDFQDLEDRLARLAPAAPSAAFTRRTGRKLDSMERNRQENRVVWVRFAPVAAAACVVLTSTFLLRNQLIEQQVAGVAPQPESDFEIMPPSSLGPAPILDDDRALPIGHFQPVSQGNQLRGFERGNIVGPGENGILERELFLRYDNTQHFYDPTTETNLRIYIPQEGVLRIPVPVD